MLAGCASEVKGTRGAAAQAQRTASERRRARRKVNQRFLSAMADMGIPAEKAELALSETGNVGVEVRGIRVRIRAAPARSAALCAPAEPARPSLARRRAARAWEPQPGRLPEDGRAMVLLCLRLSRRADQGGPAAQAPALS